MRRLIWTLARAHGMLLARVDLVFALCLPLLPALDSRRRAPASTCLLTASVRLPQGAAPWFVAVVLTDRAAGVSGP